MHTDSANVSRPTFYTVREAARILRVGPSTLYRAIREDAFPAVRLRTRYVIPAVALEKLLAEATERGTLVDPARMAADVRLRRLRRVPDDVLAEIVAAEGLAGRQLNEVELGSGCPVTDRELAAQLCAGCPVQDECLELDLRWMADQTLGVFAGLTEADRRTAYPLWLTERRADACPSRRAQAGANAGDAR